MNARTMRRMINEEEIQVDWIALILATIVGILMLGFIGGIVYTSSVADRVACSEEDHIQFVREDGVGYVYCEE